MKKINFLIIFILFLSIMACSSNKSDYDSYLFVGTYTSGSSKGINIYQLNTETGDTKFIGEKELFNPSYLAISKDGNYIYAVSEGDSLTSKVTAYKFDKKGGNLEYINEQSSGTGPCFVAVDGDNKWLITADYGGGSISYFEIMSSSGGIAPATIKTFKGQGLHSSRQAQPHLHNIIYSPDERFLFANDLGTDRIYRFEINKNEINFMKQTEPAFFQLEAGSGPRHTTFHPNGKFAYTITELSGDVLVFDYDSANGLFHEIQQIKADTLNAQGSADIHITPNGRYLYASNRLQGDGIAIFSIDQETGLLTKIGYQATGIHPRNFMITPNGKLLLVANRDSNNIQIFSIKEDGLLTNRNKDILLSMPVCVKILPLSDN